MMHMCCMSFSVLCEFWNGKLEEWDVSEIKEIVGAYVHDVVMHLLPAKVNKHNSSVCYFDG